MAKPVLDVYSDSDDQVDTQADLMDDVESFEYKYKGKEGDDSDIDDSEAFNSDDEAKYAQFFPSKSASSKASVMTATLAESSILDEGFNAGNNEDGGDTEESDFESDYSDEDGLIPLSDMLNGPPAKESSFVPEFAMMDESDDDVSSNEANPMLESSDDEDNINDDGLSSLIDNLDNSKTQPKKRKRALAHEVTEAFEESEYNVNARIRDTSQPNKKLNVGDLMGALNPESTSFGGLKKQLSRISTLNERNTGKLGTTLAIPLPKRASDRLEREAAYEKAKQEVRKWSSIVQKNRQAETLSFPLNPTVMEKTTSGALMAKFEVLQDSLIDFQPKSSMEVEIQELLEKGGLSSKKQIQLEDLAMTKLSKEEVTIRRAELAKMRSLMFFEEQKMKKIAKIKSKTYRKLNRKKKGEELDLEALKTLDPEAAREKLMQMERDRALERMTLKHKNSGKWAKKMLGRDTNSETRRALMDQLAKHEELKKKISGYNSSDEDDISVNSNSDEDDETVARAIDKLNNLQQEVQETEIPQTGVFAMKFMRRNLQDQVDATKKGIKKLKDDFEDSDASMDDSDEESHANPGRRKFAIEGKSLKAERGLTGDINEPQEHKHDEIFESTGPIQIDHSIKLSKVKATAKAKAIPPIFKVDSLHDGLLGIYSSLGKVAANNNANKTNVKALLKRKGKKVETEEDPESVEPLHSVNSKPSVQPAQFEVTDKSLHMEDEEEGNPWLQSSSKPLMKSIKQTSSTHGRVGKQTKALEKLINQRKERIDLEAEPDAHESAQLDMLLPILESPKALKKSVELLDNGSDSESEAPGFEMAHAKNIAQLSQLEVMQMAFADDNIFQDFQAEKDIMVERDAPKEEDLTLPGWGSWSGNGAKEKKRVVLRKIKSIDNVEASKRKDAHLKHVIINEKRQKKTIKYMASKLPHGFQNREQYERTIRVPLGKEWQTSNSHEILSRPKIEVEEGMVIHPIKMPGSRKTVKTM